MVTTAFAYGEDTLDLATCMALQSGERKGVLSARAKDKITASARHVQALVQGDSIVYGVNTGFGSLCNTKIAPDALDDLQENLLKSHSTGVGDPIPMALVRLMMVLKIHALSRGYSGVSLPVVEQLLYFLRHNLTPRVPAKGSLGASGDLAPLAHLSLPLIGLGELWDEEQMAYVPAQVVLRKKERQAIRLSPKDGLALINGTQFMVAQAVWGLRTLHRCLAHADIIAAMSMEGFMASVEPFDDKLHTLRPFANNRLVADRIRRLLRDSEIVRAHANCGRVQDPYSFRCIPQVHGASRNAWTHAVQAVEIEMNAVTDNPIVWSRNKTLNGGNFHGQPIALPLDYATLAAAELGSIAERRIYQLSHGAYGGVPQLLVRASGLHSGFMILQYTAAALVSENKILTHPASADTIPTSLGQEDHVSMGAIGGRKLNEVVDNVEHIMAIELLFAAQAFAYRRPLRSGQMLEACYEKIRSEIAYVEGDRCFYKDIDKALRLLQRETLMQCCCSLP